MERLKDAIRSSDRISEAWLVSDRAVEILLSDGRTILITAQENLKSGGYSAEHRVGLEIIAEGRSAEVWGPIDLPWADGETIDDCLTKAIVLLHGP